MAVDWNLYTARLNLDGSSDRERNINEMKRRISQAIVNSPSYKSNGLVIIDTLNPYVKNFVALSDNTVLAGMVKDYRSSKYLITAVDIDNEVNMRGTMERCNYELKFLNSFNHPTSRWCCVENATKYNSGAKPAGTVAKIELGSSQYLVKLSYDEETALLDRVYPDGNDRRLLLDFGTSVPNAYRVTQTDRVSYPGLVVLTLTEDTRSGNDNLSLMIADYYSRVAPSPVQPTYPLCKIVYSYEPVLEVGKGYKKFQAVFYDTEGNVENLDPVWTVTASDSLLLEYVLTQSDEDYILIKVTSNLLVGKSVTLTLKNQAETLTTSINLEVCALG